MKDFNVLETYILQLIKRGLPEHSRRRENIFAQCLDYGYTIQQIQPAFTRLRQVGAIYKAPEGWYKTDISIDAV